MVAEIGILIAGYVIVRMVSFLTRTGEWSEHSLVKVLAAGMFLVTLVIGFDLLMRGVLALTRFRGHLTPFGRRSHDGQAAERQDSPRLPA